MYLYVNWWSWACRNLNPCLFGFQGPGRRVFLVFIPVDMGTTSWPGSCPRTLCTLETEAKSAAGRFSSLGPVGKFPTSDRHSGSRVKSPASMATPTAPPSFSFPEHSTTTFPKESFGLPHPSILLGAFGRQILEQYLSSIHYSGTALNSADLSPGIGIYSTAASTITANRPLRLTAQLTAGFSVRHLLRIAVVCHDHYMAL
ncbi:hypothetical protein NEUTE1DRAFT_114070 [Neurospora tetrasperma FGSC 2508]|uniref:Uncharacterized protein n=1 Tax=Neurospora tetrasperma (strain FGSC 2508 / ATCC MYA-4615 / P0657) TaxID=510951 RepID=F8MZS2_NEUT8|nr:uncharacterized protein NEUTE1DRAFT_114070 [Neurospora tetrasperma FGSC 2508]EGO52059.1 hypothetical protein NEUTE1DRAFT_114070 [Neurospora tetrasperma FGSC 2508]